MLHSPPTARAPTLASTAAEGRAAHPRIGAMFKRFTQEECISSQSQIKSSVGRGIRSAILEQYPKIEAVVDDLLPKKDPMVIAKCTNHIQLLVVRGEPVFFQQRDGPWYPTLRLVHRHASVFADAGWRTDAGAIRFVLSGANIMCPGFTHEDGQMGADIPVDAPVVVSAAGKKHAMAVGQVKMCKADIQSKNKGICVDNMHFLNDGAAAASPGDSRARASHVPFPRRSLADPEARLRLPGSPGVRARAPIYINLLVDVEGASSALPHE